MSDKYLNNKLRNDINKTNKILQITIINFQ